MLALYRIEASRQLCMLCLGCIYSFILSAGRDVWMATTRAFADQLESQGLHQRAVLYYLACHHTYKAIDVFRKQAMYRYVNIYMVSARGVR